MTQAAINNAKVLYGLGISKQEVSDTDQIFFTAPQLLEVLTNPIISIEKKENIIDEVFKLGNISDVMIRFLKKMCVIDECYDMRNIFDAYYQYYDEQNHILRAEYVSAKKADATQLEKAESFLKKNYPDFTIELEQCIDESLLGGYLIKVHNEEYDHSFKGRLEQLERKLTGR